MSEPKRFNFSATIVHHIGGEKTAALKYHTEPDGLFVSYEDYARLNAEVERLTAFTTRTIIPNEELQARIEGVLEENSHLHKGIYSLSLNVCQLRDEVERLTKAGDAMVPLLGRGDWHIARNDWNAAKEGKGQP